MKKTSLFIIAFLSAATSAEDRDCEMTDQLYQRACDTESRMTDEERFSLIHGIMPIPDELHPRSSFPAEAIAGAGFVPGVPRLGIPSLRETDGSLGVTNPFSVRPGDNATAMPSTLVLASTFDPVLARKFGNAIGREARFRGFNLLLTGGANLTRDPRNGRNFEYLSEDPLLTGVMAGASIAGTQQAGVISTLKHFALNANETNRHFLDAVIDPAALRESDLLAFQIAIEQGQPGSVMGAYNKVNGIYSTANTWLLQNVLRKDWDYKGWVMSDWGSVAGADSANRGLDQQSGAQLDKQVWFDGPLNAMLHDGSFSHERLSQMVRRILRSMYAVGIDKDRPLGADDRYAAQDVALDTARKGITLLKNEGILPLGAPLHTVLVIGGHANQGVLAGGGSSQVVPRGGNALSIPVGGNGVMGAYRVEAYARSSPQAELAKLLYTAKVTYDPGVYPQVAASLARGADVAVVFVTKHESEAFDSPDLSLPGSQDALITAVAKANPNTVVVLETGNPVLMPWRDAVRGIVAAWYPGEAGGQAIAEILTGKVNPSGRLPMTFPAAEADLPRPTLPGFGLPNDAPNRVEYTEGAAAGYRWFATRGQTPIYPFGHGLSYTQFAYSGLRVNGGKSIAARFEVRNTGPHEGADVPQVYLLDDRGNRVSRLLGFERINLKPGESRVVNLQADPRFLANFDERAQRWIIAGGYYHIGLARSAGNIVLTGRVRLAPGSFTSAELRTRQAR